jgi:hypothetical protein
MSELERCVCVYVFVLTPALKVAHGSNNPLGSLC